MIRDTTDNFSLKPELYRHQGMSAKPPGFVGND
jgi:hypothetical protein